MIDILGFDCATKSLGVCHLRFDTSLFSVHSQLKASLAEGGDVIETVRALSDLYSRILSVRSINVFDLIPGQKVADTTRIDRLIGLKRVLHRIKVAPNLVLIENQIADKARTICDGIVYHYADDISGYEEILSHAFSEPRCITTYLKPPAVKIVMPSIKNTISFSADTQYKGYIKKYASNYQVNKAHSRENLIRWAKIHKLDISHIKRANLDDAGDAMMMIVGFLGRLGL